MRTKSLKKNRINVVTLGCSKNVYDSEVLMGQLKASGKDVVHEEEGNIVVINTCGFINNAKEESVNTILEYVQKKEDGDVDKVFVTGCLSERYKPDLVKEIPNVDAYFGTTELPGLLKALGADYKHELKLCLFKNCRRLRQTVFVLCHSNNARKTPQYTY